MSSRRRGVWGVWGSSWAWVAVALALTCATPERAAAQSRPGLPEAVPGLAGAIRIPVTIDRAGDATFILVDQDDNLLRVLAQVVPVQPGKFQVAWDGLDYYGNPVSADRKVRLKVITNPGIKAIYQMAVGSSGSPAWPTGRTGEGDASRQGGNLGDHTGPNTVAGVGDRMFFGSALVEHGHNLMAALPDGTKLWGAQIEGWAGPGHMATDGKLLYLVTRGNKTVYSVDPATFKVSKLFDTGPDEVVTFAADKDGKLTFVLKNHAAGQEPFRRSKLVFDFDRCVPKPSGGKAPEFQINGQQAFAAVFNEGGHFQAGFDAAALDDKTAYAIAALKEPAVVGAVLLEKVANATQAELFVLKPGVAYDPARHDPKRAGSLSDDWQPFGVAKFERRVEVLTAARADQPTSAVLVRLPLADASKKAALRMIRLQQLRVTQVPADIKPILPDAATPVDEKDRYTKPRGPANGWDVRTDTAISEVSPLVVKLDLGGARTFQGLSLLNATSPHVQIAALADGADLATATDEQWKPLVNDSAKNTKGAAWLSGQTNSYDRQIDFPEPVTTRALRLTYTSGVLGNRGPNRTVDDPNRGAVGDLILLGLADALPKVPSHLVQVRDTAGKVLESFEQDAVELRRLARDVDGDGTLYGITPDALVRVTIAGGKLATSPVAGGFKNTMSVAARDGRVAVGDHGGNAIHVYDARGQKLYTIGGVGPYQRGPYNPNVVGRPAGLGFAADGSLWVAEDAYHPKRLAHFDAAGKHVRDLWGPPEYGGGGWLDPNLKAFYYRGMEFGLDLAAGAWKLNGFNDRYLADDSPVLENSSFDYTRMGRPIRLNGRTYVVSDPGGGVSVAILENGVWKPAAVVAGASGNRFLIARDVWKAHWLKQNLKDKAFIWTDRNGDGQTQIDEVELFDNKGPFLAAAYWISRVGPDLTIWTTSMRLAPTTFTAAGVPVYESAKIRRFKFTELATPFMANMKVGENAKRGFGDASMVAADGTLAVEGQPYRVGPDLKLAGNPPSVKPSDYVPPIRGLIMDNPMTWAGSAMTASPLGEVAIMNGTNGHWFLWSLKYNCVVGWVFTGKNGGWGGVPDVRGTDVTGNKQDWETFFGSFAKADDGNYYTVTGRGHHAISRIENLDAFQVAEVPVTPTAEQVAANTTLRASLASQAAALKAGGRREERMGVELVAKRAANLRVDGDLAEWGDAKKFVALGPTEAGPDGRKPETRVRFAAATDDAALHLAFAGAAGLKNSAEDPKFVFKGGFCFDLFLRTDAKARGDSPVPGDRRVLVGNVRGTWTAVLFEYVDPAVRDEQYVLYESPVATTRVARVTVLPANAVRVALKESGPSAGAEGLTNFTAEVSIDYAAIGLKQRPAGDVRADVGILSADPTGGGVAHRWYWSNPADVPITDMAMEAAIYPQTLGLMQFPK